MSICVCSNLGTITSCFKIYPGFVLRHADLEMIVMKAEVPTHRSQETGGTGRHAGSHGEAPGLVGRQKER